MGIMPKSGPRKDNYCLCLFLVGMKLQGVYICVLGVGGRGALIRQAPRAALIKGPRASCASVSPFFKMVTSKACLMSFI